MAKVTEKNPKGAGRPTVENGRVTLCISGKKEQLDQLRNLAKENEMTVSQFVFEKTGVKIMDNKWFVANDDGDVIGHDMSEAKAKALAAEMQEKEPEANWEALNGADED